MCPAVLVCSLAMSSSEDTSIEQVIQAMSTKSSRAKFGAAVVVAFLCGLLFASGFDLTRFGWAQGRVGSSNATKPTAAQVAPAADMESAFEAVADHARPAVVSIATERFQKPRSNTRLRGRSGG